jgi:hypothetical protein
MSLEDSDALATLRDAIRSQLQHHFASNQIDIDELESRLMQLHEATNEVDLEMVVADLEPAPPVPATKTLVPVVETPESALARPARQHATIVNVFSGTDRTGPWRPPQLMKIVSVFGGAKLDFRNAELQNGVTEVRCISVFGGVEIIVPPDLYVEMEGGGFFGAFDRKNAERAVSRPGDRSLLVTGIAIFAGTTVKVKPHEE